ncbi:MAG: FAD-dependent monooxygenase, partial [Saprospiraceae bacterium]
CGDVISPVALTELQQIGVTGSPEFAATNEISKAGLYFTGQKIAEIELPKGDDMPFYTRVIPRLEIDHWIYEAARKAGAVFLENAQLTHYTRYAHCVSATIKQGGESKRLKAKMIVGADGSSSTVARIFNGSKPADTDRLLALRAYYEDINGPADSCDIHFTGDNFPGIYWIFPTGPTTANVGLGMVAKTLPDQQSHIQALLTNQIRQNKPLAERIGKGRIKGKIQGWPLTMYRPEKAITGDRLLLIGDAAGLINSLSGDGIQYALLSGRWAAECLAECVDKNDFSAAALLRYKTKVDQELGYDFALSNLLVQIARNRTLNPAWMRILLVLMERARVDPGYATILGGIFGGTHPSYKALQPDFILKTILQGGIHVGMRTASGVFGGPDQWKQIGKGAGQLAQGIVRNIREQPVDYAGWAGEVARQGWKVSGHILKDLLDRSKR